MAYYGMVEVEVRLMREGYGPEGKQMSAEATRVVRMELGEAREIRSQVEASKAISQDYGRLAPVAVAVKQVIDSDEAAELNQRWNDAVGSATPERKRQALAVLEGRDAEA